MQNRECMVLARTHVLPYSHPYITTYSYYTHMISIPPSAVDHNYYHLENLCRCFDAPACRFSLMT